MNIKYNCEECGTEAIQTDGSNPDEMMFCEQHPQALITSTIDSNSNLFLVLQGIMRCDKDVRDDNLSDISAIERYAEACEENITFAEAALIQKVGKQLIDKLDNGNGEWERMWHEAESLLELETA